MECEALSSSLSHKHMETNERGKKPLLILGFVREDKGARVGDGAASRSINVLSFLTHFPQNPSKKKTGNNFKYISNM